MTDRKKPGVAFWATVGLVVVLLGYPLSIGAVDLLLDRLGWPGPSNKVMAYFYEPVNMALRVLPEQYEEYFGAWDSWWRGWTK
jgi:hypothetical protein